MAEGTAEARYGPRVRILFTTPAYFPAVAFGGPIVMARELNEGMVERGHSVEVLTTTLTDVEHGRTLHGRFDIVGGVRVHYLATPLRYRWMGVTPTAPLELARLTRPDVCHVFGFRDPLGTATALWCRARGIPYVLEPLGMFEPRVRKIALKHVLDRSVLRPIVTGAAAIVATSEVERGAMIDSGGPADRIVVRGNGFPARPQHEAGRLRGDAGIRDDETVVLSVGRIAAGKGIEFVLAAAEKITDAHFVFVGPDDGHGVAQRLRDAATRNPRIHVLGPRTDTLALYGDADLFVLASEGESFGMVAAEAAAAGVPVVVTDRSGVSEFLGDAAVVVPAERDAVVRAVADTLADAELRWRLGEAASEAAARNSWARMVERQEQIYVAAMRS
jgi:glycosyltransferase involved in cell wall biosynthesis